MSAYNSVLNPQLRLYLNEINDAPMGPVALITAHPTQVYFDIACQILDRHSVIIHPNQLTYKLAGLELALALVDNRVFLGQENHELLQTRMRVPGTTVAHIRWIELP